MIAVIIAAALLPTGESHSERLESPTAALRVSNWRIENMGEVPSVVVEIQLRTGDSELALPYCGTSQDGDHLLCLECAHLQHKLNGAWSSVLRRRLFGLLGVTKRTGVVKVKARGSQRLKFVYSRRFFEVEPGQQLRIVVDAWADDQSVPSQFETDRNPAPYHLQTPVFRCPAIPIR